MDQDKEKIMLKDRYSALSRTEQRIFWSVIALSAILGVFAVTLVDTFLQAPSFQYRLVNALPLFLSLLSLLGAILLFFGKRGLASWVLLLGTLAILLLAVSQAQGYGFPAAFVLTAVTVLVPLQLLHGKSTLAALGVGIAGTVAIILIDTFSSGARVPAATGDVNAARIATAILGLIILAAIIRQYREYSIRAKLLILAVGTGLISILIVAGFTSYATQQALQQETSDALISAAHHSIEQVDDFIKGNMYRLIAEAQLPSVVEYMKVSAEQRTGMQDDILGLFKALSQSDPAHINSYALLDRSGKVLVDSEAKNIGQDQADQAYFTIPAKTGITFVSPVTYKSESKDSSFTISTPVFNNYGDVLGILLVEFHSSILDQILSGNSGFAGEGSYAILLDEYNAVVAHGTEPGWASHTLVRPDPATLDQLVKNHRLADIPVDKLSLNLPGFAQSLQNLSADRPFFSSTDAAWGTPMEVGVAASDITSWKIAYVQPQATALETIVQQRKVISLTALLTAILIAIAGIFVAGTITQPISSLASTAEQIAEGDLSARAHVGTGDELHALANAFNRMTDRLKDTLGGLEQRVAERTADLDSARLLSERRAQELQSISEISRLISHEQQLDTLLTLITRLVSERFNFYHVGIFLVDSTRQFAVLQAANSEGGQRMLARGHRLEVGHTGIVGNVAKTGEPRIALDVGTDAVYFDNPDLPLTRSEMALPLNVHGETIGVLDVQSTQAGVFTENEANTLSILADQIAIAIANARLFGQNKQALDELQSLYNQYLGQEWKTFIHKRQQLGYIQSLTGGRPLDVALSSVEIQQALDNGQVVVLPPNEKSLPVMAIPLKLRGQTIGVLNITAPTANRIWSQAEIHLAQAVSDRLALALDNARLLFVSQRQTAKEQKIGEVTAKIGASMNMRNVLQTAVEELGRALPGSEVIIQFESNGKQG